MRDIKFRGKRLDNGEWVHGDLVHITTKGGVKGTLIIHDTQVVGEPTSDGAVLSYDRNDVSVVIPATVGQFTGLNDKNGKEIYEGDVLFVREWENLAMRMFDHEERKQLSLEDCKGGVLYESQRVVYFEEGSMCAGDYYISTLWDEQDKRNQYPIFEVELLGNIHDNPEFLK